MFSRIYSVQKFKRYFFHLTPFGQKLDFFSNQHHSQIVSSMQLHLVLTQCHWFIIIIIWETYFSCRGVIWWKAWTLLIINSFLLFIQHTYSRRNCTKNCWKFLWCCGSICIFLKNSSYVKRTPLRVKKKIG